MCSVTDWQCGVCSVQSPCSQCSVHDSSGIVGGVVGGSLGIRLGMLSVRDLLRLYNIPTLKRLSQNFILDSNVTDKIARVAVSHAQRVVSGDDGDAEPRSVHVIEVGPGPGGLTQSLLGHPDVVSVVGVEKDDRFERILTSLAAETDAFSVTFGDVLSLLDDGCGSGFGSLLSSSADAGIVVGNLPFNVASPLLMRLLATPAWGDPDSGLDGMTLMFQAEVARKMGAPIGKSGYGRLAVMTQAFASVSYDYEVPASVFVPPPKVNAGVVSLSPSPIPRQIGVSFAQVESLVRSAFSSRRKQLKNNLGKVKGAVGVLEEKGWARLRPQDLTPVEYLELTHLVQSSL